MSTAQFRRGAESFFSALEEERYREEVGGARARVGELYSRAGQLFSLHGIAEIQRALAETAGPDERRTRALLEFAATGYALMRSAVQLDEWREWEWSKQVLPEGTILPARIAARFAATADHSERHELESAYLRSLDTNAYLAEEFVGRHRDALAELGYGGHVETLELLRGVDVHVLAREGAAFLRESEGLYSELLAWHAPRALGAAVDGLTAADALRLERGAGWDQHLPGGEAYRAAMAYLGGIGVDPTAEGRIRFEWGANLPPGTGGICRAPKVPDLIRLAVQPSPGRPGWSSFLRAFGTALHLGFTDPTLSLEERQMGDGSVTLATGDLFATFLRTPPFLRRTFALSREHLLELRRFETLMELLRVRREIGLLRFVLAFYSEDADGDTYSDLLFQATGFRHDPREASWRVDVELHPARRLRAAQLAGVHAEVLRERFDEDWFRNPAAGGYLRDLFSNGRRHTAPELARQLGADPLRFAVSSFEP